MKKSKQQDLNKAFPSIFVRRTDTFVVGGYWGHIASSLEGIEMASFDPFLIGD